jgi:hypothetical protein
MEAVRLAAGFLLLFSLSGAKAQAQFSREGMKAARDLAPDKGKTRPANSSVKEDAGPTPSVLFLHSDLLMNPKPVVLQSMVGWDRASRTGCFGGFVDCRLRRYVVPGSISIIQTASGQRIVTFQTRILRFPRHWVYFGSGHP